MVEVNCVAVIPNHQPSTASIPTLTTNLFLQQAATGCMKVGDLGENMCGGTSGKAVLDLIAVTAVLNMWRWKSVYHPFPSDVYSSNWND